MFIQLTEEQVAFIQVKDQPMVGRKSRTKLTEPREVFEYIKHIGGLRREHVILISLDVRRRVIAKNEISVGTIDSSLVHPREVFRAAIQDGASSIIVAHNHPSGDTEPSEDDILITKRLMMAGKILGIAVLDHMVIGQNEYYSLREHERM